MKYRKADSSDIEQLKLLGKHSYSEYAKLLSGENWEKMYIFLDDDKLLRSLVEQSTAFVCEEKKELVGMIYLVPSGNPVGLFEANWSCIRYLGVKPSYRGMGIGRKLTQLCIKKARDNKEEVVALHTSDFMNNAMKLYEDLGFKRIKDFQHYGKKYWIYLLHLK